MEFSPQFAIGLSDGTGGDVNQTAATPLFCQVQLTSDHLGG
jgi:hypothetical protein